MVKGVELAARWKCSPAYISKLKAKGMPMDSFETADSWRASHASEGIGHKSTSSTPSPTVTLPPSAPTPADSLAEAERHLADHVATPPPSESFADSDPRSAVHRAQTAERDIYDLLAAATRTARDEKSPASDRFAAAAALPGLIRTHGNAYANRLDAEARWEKHRRATGEVATVAQFMEVMEAALVPLASQLRNFPRTHAAACNPATPAVAANALTAAIDPILAQIANALVAPAASPASAS